MLSTARAATANLIYIDGTDTASEGTFVSNATAEALAYTNWREGEPSNTGGNENCILYRKKHRTWNDVSCSTKLQAICEKGKFLQTITKLKCIVWKKNVIC